MSPGAEPKSSTTARASDVFKAPAVWVPPLILVSILVFVMTLVYFGSLVDPAGHLHRLPVALVNEDAGATVGTQRVDFGRQVVTGLSQAPAVARPLSLRSGDLREIKDRM